MTNSGRWQEKVGEEERERERPAPEPP